MANHSTLDANIEAAFSALSNAEIVTDAYWRYRDAHAPLEAERRAYLFARADALLAIAVRRTRLAMSAVDRLRVRIELSDFLCERVRYMEQPRP